MTQQKITLGISACLLGQALRYDGSQAKAPLILKQMFNDYEFLGYCPEVMAGMGTPREVVRLIDVTDELHIVGSKSQQDWTEQMHQATQTIISQVTKNQLRGYILKSRSPSCGLSSAKIYNSNGVAVRKGAGIFSQALQEQVYVPLIEAEMLNCSKMTEKFIRLTHLADDFFKLEQYLSKHALTSLYARYKLSLMAYSPIHYQAAGKLLGKMNGLNLHAVKNDLYLIMFDGFNRLSSRKRQTNALMHIQGYFRKILTATEKSELTQIIHNYSQGFVPLAVPLTLIRHYLLLHPDDYLLQQNYIAHPLEHYGLRNYV